MMEKILCAEIDVSFIPDADITIVPLWINKDSKYEPPMSIDEVICEDVEHMECDTDYHEMQTVITYRHYDEQFLVNIGCLVLKKQNKG